MRKCNAKFFVNLLTLKQRPSNLTKTPSPPKRRPCKNQPILSRRRNQCQQRKQQVHQPLHLLKLHYLLIGQLLVNTHHRLQGVIMEKKQPL